MHAEGGDEWGPSTPRSPQSRPSSERNGTLPLVRPKVNGGTAFGGHKEPPVTVYGPVGIPDPLLANPVTMFHIHIHYVLKHDKLHP